MTAMQRQIVMGFVLVLAEAGETSRGIFSEQPDRQSGKDGVCC